MNPKAFKFYFLICEVRELSFDYHEPHHHYHLQGKVLQVIVATPLCLSASCNYRQVHIRVVCDLRGNLININYNILPLLRPQCCTRVFALEKA